MVYYNIAKIRKQFMKSLMVVDTEEDCKKYQTRKSFLFGFTSFMQF